LLSIVGKDDNNQILWIALVIVEVETNDSWAWLLVSSMSGRRLPLLARVGVEPRVLLDHISGFLKSSVEAHISSCLGLIWVFHDLLVFCCWYIVIGLKKKRSFAFVWLLVGRYVVWVSYYLKFTRVGSFIALRSCSGGFEFWRLTRLCVLQDSKGSQACCIRCSRKRVVVHGSILCCWTIHSPVIIIEVQYLETFICHLFCNYVSCPFADALDCVLDVWLFPPILYLAPSGFEVVLFFLLVGFFSSCLLGQVYAPNTSYCFRYLWCHRWSLHPFCLKKKIIQLLILSNTTYSIS